MKLNRLFIAAMIVLIALVGCKKEATPAPEAQMEPGQYASPNLGTDYENAMDSMNQLVLGTLKLEGTPDAVTPEQAQTLLPLWQLIQEGTLQSMDETNAVLKQIESKMSSAQVAAIEGMQLTNDDMRMWMEEQGIELPEWSSPEGQEGLPQGQGGPGAFQDLSEEERAQMREEFQNMSPEARATRMAEMGLPQQPGGQGEQGFDPNAMATRRVQGSGGRPGGGSFLIQPLIDLLTERAAQ